METKKPTISIGIPAYNEEGNIGNLISSILSQQTISGDLIEIIIVSDASTDGTIRVAESFKDPRIKIIKKEVREGAFRAQNQITQMANTDILIMLNADILPANNNFLEEIIKPIIKNPRVGISCARMISAKPRTFFEKIIIHSYRMKRVIFDSINNGNNLYNCVGVARAFSKNLYKKVVWPEGLPEDAYSYFACLKEGLEFIYNPESKLIFRTSSNLIDHKKQSTRFFGGKIKMERVFGKEMVRKEYGIPKSLIFNALIQSIVTNPILTLSYAILMIYINIFSVKKYEAKWQIASSTKESITSQDII